MLKRIIILLILVIGFFFLQLFIRAGQFKTIVNKPAGEVVAVYRNLPGPEDMQADYVLHKMFIAAANRRPSNSNAKPDGIYLLDLASMAPPYLLATTYTKDLHPHGLSLWSEDTLIYLYVVNHNEEGDFVEKFLYTGSDTLQHLASYSSPLMCCLNDVAATGPSSFYVTNDHGSRAGFSRKVEDYLNIGRASVVYFDGSQYRKVARHLNYANGINYDRRHDKLYVATTTGKALLSFTIEADGGLIREHVVDLETGLDNIDIDRQGNLWIAAHPKMLDFLKHAADSTNYSPSQVVKLMPTNEGFDVEDVYINDGSEFSASSVAVSTGTELFIGGVFDHKLLRIKLNH